MSQNPFVMVTTVSNFEKGQLIPVSSDTSLSSLRERFPDSTIMAFDRKSCGNPVILNAEIAFEKHRGWGSEFRMILEKSS